MSLNNHKSNAQEPAPPVEHPPLPGKVLFSGKRSTARVGAIIIGAVMISVSYRLQQGDWLKLKSWNLPPAHGGTLRVGLHHIDNATEPDITSMAYCNDAEFDYPGHPFQTSGSTGIPKKALVHWYDRSAKQCVPLPGLEDKSHDAVAADGPSMCMTGGWMAWKDRAALHAAPTPAERFLHSCPHVFDAWKPWPIGGTLQAAAADVVPPSASASKAQAHYPPMAGGHRKHNLYHLRNFCVDSGGRLIGNKGGHVAAFEGITEHRRFPEQHSALGFLLPRNRILLSGEDRIPLTKFHREKVLLMPLDQSTQGNTGHQTYRWATAASITTALDLNVVIFLQACGDRDGYHQMNMYGRPCPAVIASRIAEGKLHTVLAFQQYFGHFDLPYVYLNVVGGETVRVPNRFCPLATRDGTPFRADVPATAYNAALRALFDEAHALHADRARAKIHAINTTATGADLLVAMQHRFVDLLKASIAALPAGGNTSRNTFDRDQLMCFAEGYVSQIFRLHRDGESARPFGVPTISSSTCDAEVSARRAWRQAQRCHCAVIQGNTNESDRFQACEKPHFIFSDEAEKLLAKRYRAAITHIGSASERQALAAYDDVLMGLLRQHPVRLFWAWRTRNRRMHSFHAFFGVIQQEVGRFFRFAFREGPQRPRGTMMREYFTTDIVMGIHGADLHATMFVSDRSLLVEFLPVKYLHCPLDESYFGSMAYQRGIGYLAAQVSQSQSVTLELVREVVSLAVCTWLATNSVKLTKPYLLPFWCREQSADVTPAWQAFVAQDRVSTPEGTGSPDLHVPLNRYGFAVPSCPALALRGAKTGALHALDSEISADASEWPAVDNTVTVVLTPAHLRTVQATCVAERFVRLYGPDSPLGQFRALSGALEAYAGLDRNAAAIAAGAIVRHGGNFSSAVRDVVTTVVDQSAALLQTLPPRNITERIAGAVVEYEAIYTRRFIRFKKNQPVTHELFFRDGYGFDPTRCLMINNMTALPNMTAAAIRRR